MNTRQLIFKNFRNLGVKVKDEYFLNSRLWNLSNKLSIGPVDKDSVGGLIVLLGGNNDGKSNVLHGFERFGSKKLDDIDKPNFKDCEEKSPIITLECKITDKEIIEKIESLANKKEASNVESGHFSDKTFWIFFTDGSLKKGMERNNCSTEKEYCAFIEKMFKDSEIYGIYGQDESSGRLEIRLILKKHKRMLLCSVNEGGQGLKCFSAVVKNMDEIKDMDRAIKLDCDFRVDSSVPKNCDDAGLLKKFLKEEFEKNDKSGVQNKTQNNKMEQQILYLQTSIKLQEQNSGGGGVFLPQSKRF